MLLLYYMLGLQYSFAYHLLVGTIRSCQTNIKIMNTFLFGFYHKDDTIMLSDSFHPDNKKTQAQMVRKGCSRSSANHDALFSVT